MGRVRSEGRIQEVRMSQSAQVTILHGMSAGELREVLSEVPDNATLSVNSVEGDRPWESGYHTLSFSWTKEIYGPMD